MAAERFDRLAGWLAIVVGIGGLVFGGLFVWIMVGAPQFVRVTWFLLLLLGGLLTTGVYVGVYRWLREGEPALALWALVLTLAGALGGILHGAYQLAVTVEGTVGLAGADPEVVTGGVLRYGVGGVGLLILGGLIARSERFPRGLGSVGMAAGVLLIILYAGRLSGLVDPAERLTQIVPALYGVVVHPVFFVWLGRSLLRPAPAAP